MLTHTHIVSALWLCFRCVKGEGEIEKLQAKVVELRRKLDDTTAAMQELGRENQSLQVSRKTPILKRMTMVQIRLAVMYNRCQ